MHPFRKLLQYLRGDTPNHPSRYRLVAESAEGRRHQIIKDGKPVTPEEVKRITELARRHAQRKYLN